MKKLNEGLDYHDMKGQIDSKITVDEYAAKMGKNSDIVTVTFITNSKLAAQDLVTWLELGYDYVLDASVSEGELEPGKWLVFVEMKRKPNVPKKIIEILEDLNTLTDMDLDDYVVEIDDEEHKADIDELKNHIILTPEQYENENEPKKELDEMRTIAGLDIENHANMNDDIQNMRLIAGL